MILSPLSCINMIIGGRHRFVPPDHLQPSESGAPGPGQTKTRGGVSPDTGLFSRNRDTAAN